VKAWLRGRPIGRRTALLALALTPLSLAARADLATFSVTKIVIETEKGKFPFTVELAVTQSQMAQGLMYRRMLAPDAGMLFDYGEPQTIAKNMKNVLLPLDLVFVAADGKVVDVRERAVPLSLDAVVSSLPARALLEVNGGTAARLGLKPGAVVHHAFFGNAMGSE